MLITLSSKKYEFALGRVHTPITSLKKEFRKLLLIDEQPTASLDVVTMQPLLLGKVLKSNIGKNEYSEWIDEGKDIYIMLQKKARLNTRDEAKKRFFEILFSKPNEKLNQMFGNAEWINWINDFKRKPFEANPHTIEKNHSNLAYLLQSNEVGMMTEVWQKLLIKGIKFLSVHDEVIVKQSEQQKAKEIFSNVLKKHLSYFRISEPEPIQTPPQSLTEYAHSLIGNHNHLHKEQIPYFDELIEQGIIKNAPPHQDLFCLSNSTPF